MIHKELREYKEEIAKGVELMLNSDLIEHKEDMFNAISKFQKAYMNVELEKFKEKIKGNSAKEIMYNLLYHAVHDSSSGHVVIGELSKDVVDEFKKIYWEEIGEYLLKPVEIYKYVNGWVINADFDKYYVPYCNGWERKRKNEKSELTIGFISINVNGEQTEYSMTPSEMYEEYQNEDNDLPELNDTILSCVFGGVYLYFETFSDMVLTFFGEK